MTAAELLYLEPTAFIAGELAAAANGSALALVGGPRAFAAVAIRSRGGALRVTPLQDHADLGVFTRARPPFAGLTLNRPHIVGVVNVTPDSFSDGGRTFDPGAAIAHGLALCAAGADIIDVGGESTRPGADPVAPAEELRRVAPVVRALAAAGALVSIDTRGAAVAAAALAAGARIVNDVGGLGDRAMRRLIASADAHAILMHMQGEPRTMQRNPCYADVLLDIYDFFSERLRQCAEDGVGAERLCLDPGIGFGKTVAHNIRLLQHVALFHGLGPPLLVGASRKGFIGRVSRGETAAQRLPGSLAAAVWAVERGVQLLRVHDVVETAQAFALYQALAAQ